MAIAHNGPNGPHTGRIGNLVYYTLNGKNVVREIGRITKPATESQLRERKITKLCMGLLRSLQVFIKVGFQEEAGLLRINAFNMAVKVNRNHITKGNYPDLEFAYDKLLLSKGPLKPAQNWQVSQIPAGLQYSWDTDAQMTWPESTDQVMLLAYFPEKEEVVYTLFGNSRLEGGAVLEIPQSLQSEYMETYISFVAADRKQTANSIYTGNFNLQGLNAEALKLIP